MNIPMSLYRVETSRLRPHPAILPTIYVHAPCSYDAVTHAYDYLGCETRADRERYAVSATRVVGSVVYPPVKDERTYAELFNSEDML